MDLWVVAAITGAGYAAKYLQNFSREKEGFSGLMSVNRKPDSPSLITHFEENAAFSRNSAHRRADKHLLDGRFVESSVVETASTSGFEGEIFDSNGEGFEASASAVGTLRRRRGGQNSVRSRIIQLQYLRPQNSLDSCLMAQFYNNRSETEDRVLTPPSSPCVPALRPFVVTDGTRVISRPSFDSFSVQVRDDKKLHSKAYPKINEAVLGGIPQLPERGSGTISEESGLKKGKDQLKKLSSSREMLNEMQMSSQEAPSGAALFCLGMSIGVTYSTLANKREVTKLKDFLKQTESLVQDLQEEIEMNDSLTVKELASVSEHKAFLYEHESSIDNNKPMEVLMNYGVESSDTHKAHEDLESMNQIEAELEAELERLELNMKGSNLRAKYTHDDDDDDDDDELNADMVADLVQGEFRADILSRKPTSDPSCDNSSSSSTTPCCSPNQAVSPRELSLRLHQVIQSRLEQRIMELEAALENNQKRVKHLESEQGLSQNYASSSSSSSRGSPITIEASYPTEAHPDAETEFTEHDEFPLVMNLSGEALDAYNEALEELNKVNGSAFEEQNSSTYKESQENQLFHRSMSGLTNQVKPSSLLFQPTLMDDEAHKTNRRTLEQLDMFGFDEGDDLLIKQIVEKARQGSSAILHAHRAMVSLDSNDK